MKKSGVRKQLFDLLINIGTSGKYTSTNELAFSDNVIQRVLGNCLLILGFFVLAIFTFVNIRNEVYIDAAICAAMALIIILLFILARSNFHQTALRTIATIFYGLMCITLISAGEAQGANFLFIYLFPLIAIIQLKMRFGVTVSMIFIIIVSVQIFVPGLSGFSYHFDVAIRILAVYILVLFAMIVIETTRRTKDQLIETQNQSLQKLMKDAEMANRELETMVRQRTQELEEQTRIAVQANRAKSEFLATVSHEIRTPLNAVIGLSEIELRSNLSNASKDNLLQIHQSGSSLLMIINDILDISKIEAGNFELVPVEYDSAAFFSDTINLNRAWIGSKPIIIVLEITGDFPRKLLGDELRVKQILSNILSNAFKYTYKGAVTLRVEWEEFSREPGKEVLLRFTLRDTGVGIRSEDMEKLFNRYTQLDAKANRMVEGTGLGLVISKNLIEMMGGSIRAESEYGKGSIFTVEIIQGLIGSADGSFEPIGEKTAKELRSFRYATKRQTVDIVRSWMPRVKVLVVDDMKVNIKVAQGQLKLYGLQIDTATSGKKAIELVKRNEYDLVFMDHMMPEMDGIETTRQLRETGYKGTIIALTANVALGMREKFISIGFNDFLAKPIDVLKLDEILNRWIPKEKKERKTGNKKSEEAGKKLIILVDDDIAILRQGRDILMKKYSVITTPSTEKLFNILNNTRPALILLDIDMPKMDGYEGIKILKSKPETKDIPVIFLVDSTGSLAEKKVRALGAVDCIRKPFDAQTLISCIEKHF